MCSIEVSVVAKILINVEISVELSILLLKFLLESVQSLLISMSQSGSMPSVGIIGSFTVDFTITWTL
jgi:hypothetical protein